MSYKMSTSEICSYNAKVNPNQTIVCVSLFHNSKFMGEEDLRLVRKAMKLDLTKAIKWDKFEQVMPAFP